MKNKTVGMMKIWLSLMFCAVGPAFAAPPAQAVDSEQKQPDKRDCIVASYYFPNYHPHEAPNAPKGQLWSEWETVKKARPRFEGHEQPKVPLWGYTDESDPNVMAKKIDAAADHGIDAFIFDWYWHDDGPSLQAALEDGFLKAPNNERLKFAIMWANHDKQAGDGKGLQPGAVKPETYDAICDYVIERYFQKPNYWTIDGKPYFSIYQLHTFIQTFGNVEKAAQALQRFREKAKAAGLPGVHINAVTFGVRILPGQTTVKNPAELVDKMGVDSVTSYVWVHHVVLPKMQTDYNYVRDKYLQYWDKSKKEFNVPFYPNVSMGWDPSPRADQSKEYGNFGYPFTNTISGNTPKKFETALRVVRDRLLADPETPNILNINCWNEWTEGSYIEPARKYGMAYLEAIRNVFGTN